MPKTPRELDYLLAGKIGGVRGERFRKELARKSPFDRFFDRQLSDEEFAAGLKKIEEMSKSAAQFHPVPGDSSTGSN